ncbi:hypothetical protein HNQ56_000573 [Anaerotaenia torta]|uniref:hypothetical protein n=1 Tax=Anaerotaenia torta TaxID=433293 RepID=UPI003D215B58
MDIRKEITRNLELIKEAWLVSSDAFPDHLTEIPSAQKQRNEAYLQKVFQEFQQQKKRLPRLPIGRKRWKKRMLKLIFGVLYQENVIGIHNTLNQKEIEAFYLELADFLKQFRRFCPELGLEELGQGIRNYTVYAMFKLIHRLPSGFCKAAFGYSMLYPFTDNYIDSSQRSPEEKLEYNQLIRDTILGNTVRPKNPHHHKTCELLRAIISQYPREADDRIYTLLLMMLEAQEDSLRQQSPTAKLTGEQRLDISLFKGGVSVLIDRFLVNKELTQADCNFYLGFGFFLQLADDLQDIGEDSGKGYQTLFTLDTSAQQTERLVNKLLNYLHTIMASYCGQNNSMPASGHGIGTVQQEAPSLPPAQINNTFIDFILTSSKLLILTSLFGSREFFSADYLNRMERYLPVSVSFLEMAKANSPELQDPASQENYIRMLELLIS